MFTSVNEQVGTIAGQVGQTPQGWNAGIFNLIQNISQGKVNFYCSDRNCAFTLWKNDKFLASQGKKMDKAAAKKFLSKGKIHYKDLVSRKTGRQYEATVEMVDPGEGNVQFNLSFPQR